MSAPRVWLITGATSGFGRVLCDLVLKNGERVVAVARRTHLLADLVEQYPADRLLVVKMDVTRPQDVADAFAHAGAAFDRIDVVFNNAGFAALGEIEGMQDDQARALFETNFWGAVTVTREAVKFFREVNPSGVGGRLLQMSSMFGLEGMYCLGFYSATKHALEGFTKSLVQELDPAWNIKVTILEPGFFRTDIATDIDWTSPHPAYTTPTLPGTALRTTWDSFVLIGDPEKAAGLFYRVAGLSDPPLHFPVGKDALALTKKTMTDLTDAVARYESWSDDLELPPAGVATLNASR